MEIFINDTKADITLENEKTVEDILKGIETECEKIDATIIGVSIDGTEIDAEEFVWNTDDIICIGYSGSEPDFPLTGSDGNLRIHKGQYLLTIPE